MTAKPWTRPEERDVVRWHHDGMTPREIARKVGRSAHAVRQKLQEIGARHSFSRSSPADGLRLAKQALAAEIALAKAEQSTSPPYKPDHL